MTNAQSNTIKTSLVPIVACGIVLGVVVAIVELATTASNYDPYKRIQVGMSRQETITLLRDARVFCGNDLLIGNSDACSFADPWREYRVTFNPGTSRVSSKSFAFRRQPSLIFR